MGASLGVSEDAAKKRVTRAVEKLRTALGPGGAGLTAAALTAVLAAHANAAAPASAAGLAAHALASTGASDAVSTLVQDTLDAWRWTRIRWTAGLGGAAVAILLSLSLIPRPVPPPDQAEASAPNNAGANSVATPPGAGIAGNAASQGNPNLRRLALRVVAQDSGRGIPGARVFLSVWREGAIEKRWDRSTDATGLCELAFERDAGRIDAGVLQDGWSARYVTWPSEGSSAIPGEYALKLAPATNLLGGVLRDPSGHPVADATIWFMGHESGDSAHRERPRERFGFASAIPVTRSDAEGRWRIGFVPAAHGGFQIEARHPDFADTTFITSPAQLSLVEIDSAPLRNLWAGSLASTLQAAFTLTGSVVDEHDAPVPGAKIQQRSQGEVFTTDARGVFTVPKLPAGPWTFTVTAAGLAPVRTNAVVGPESSPLRLRLQPGALLRVRVVDDAGEPVPNAEVGLQRWGPHRSDIDWRERSGFEGRLEWNAAPPGVDLELFARKAGYCYTRDVVVNADGSEHVIVLHPTLEVQGRVVDADGGWAVREFRATPGYGPADRFHDSDLRWFEGSNVRGTNGMFRLVFEEKAFPWQLRLRAEGYEDWVSAPLTNRQHAHFDIRMRRARTAAAARGTVVGLDGKPAAGAEVALLTFEHNVKLTRQRQFSGQPRWITRTDARGEFVFPVNRLAHSVAAAGTAGYAHQRLPDPASPVLLTLQPWGRVEGSVDDSAARLGVKTIELYDPAADNYQGRVSLLGTHSVKPEAGHRFVFDHVPPGDYCVFINSLNNIPYHHQTRVIVRPGESTLVAIQERPGTRVTGRLLPAENPRRTRMDDFRVAQFNADLPQASAITHPGPPEDRPRRELDFWSSAAGREHINTPRVYSARVLDDGSFESLENLPPGRYRFITRFQGGSTTAHFEISEPAPRRLSLGDLQLR